MKNETLMSIDKSLDNILIIMIHQHLLKNCPICDAYSANYERTLNKIDLIKCGACSFVYANLEERVIRVENSGFDEKSIEGYEKQQTYIDNLWFKRIVRKSTSRCGSGRVLDVGCGNGILLKNFIDQGWSAYGVDLSPWANRFSQMYGYKLYSSELENSNLPGNYFDVITSTSTLEHIPKPLQHLKTIMKLLKPGGTAYFSGIPNYQSLSIRLNVSSFYHNDPPRHVNYFTQESIYRLFSNPDIAKDIEKLYIITYGIPELHKIMHFFHKFKKKNINGSKNKRNLYPNSKIPKVLKRNQFWKLLATIPITIYFNLGRPFHIGDKIEVIAIKRR